MGHSYHQVERNLFGLAPGGVYHAPDVAIRAVSSYLAFSPLQAGLNPPAVFFLWHFPSAPSLQRKQTPHYGAPCPSELGLSSPAPIIGVGATIGPASASYRRLRKKSICCVVASASHPHILTCMLRCESSLRLASGAFYFAVQIYVLSLLFKM